VLPIGDLPRAIEEGRSLHWLINSFFLLCSLRAAIRVTSGVESNRKILLDRLIQ
jgi:hypothetical protein